MSRCFGIVVLATVLLTPFRLDAQHRGGRRGGGFVGRPTAGFVGRPAPVPVAPGPVFVGRPAPFVPGPVFRSPHFVHPPRTIIVTPSYGFGYYSPFSPYVYGAPVVAAPVYSEPAYVTTPAPQQPSVSQNEVELSYQVGRLSQEIEQLRQQQAQAQVPPPAPVTAIPTVLVFRDGHRMEIVNYAIVGQTLWVLDESKSIKIAIADLDLESTRRENRLRGVRFLLP